MNDINIESLATVNVLDREAVQRRIVEIDEIVARLKEVRSSLHRHSHRLVERTSLIRRLLSSEPTLYGVVSRMAVEEGFNSSRFGGYIASLVACGHAVSVGRGASRTIHLTEKGLAAKARDAAIQTEVEKLRGGT